MSRSVVEQPRGAVVVMAKAPRKGLVKTRLSSILSTYVVWQLPAGGWAVPEWALLVEYGALLGAASWLLWRRKGAPWTQEVSSSPVPPSTVP